LSSPPVWAGAVLLLLGTRGECNWIVVAECVIEAFM
jgi:hypothetical protein